MTATREQLEIAWTPTAHTDTSTAAAHHQARTGKAKRDRDRMLATLAHNRGVGATDEELGVLLELSGNTVRPRRVELASRGWVEDSGRRRLTRSGRRAIVWEITPAGEGIAREQLREIARGFSSGLASASGSHSNARSDAGGGAEAVEDTAEPGPDPDMARGGRR